MANMDTFMPTISKIADGLGELMRNVAKQAGVPDNITGVGQPHQLPEGETNGVAEGYPNV